MTNTTTTTPFDLNYLAREVAEAVAHDPAIRAVVFWETPHGDFCQWPQGTVDNRRSRIEARMRRFGLEAAPGTLVIVHV